MSTNIDHVDDGPTLGATLPGRRIDVTEMAATSVQEYVEDCVATEDVSLEHRGARTFLVVGD